MLWQPGAVAREAGRRVVEPEGAPRPGTGPAEMPSGADAEERAFIREGEVGLEVWPRSEVRDGRSVVVGYELTLSARHPRGLAADPGGEDSRRLYARLEALFQRALPAGADGLLCRLAPFRPALVLRRENGWKAEVAATLEVLHGTATFASSDEAQRRLVERLEARLEALGARLRSHRR